MDAQTVLAYARSNTLPACLVCLVALVAVSGPSMLGACALIAQLSIMSCIVYRSTAATSGSPWANVARAVVGSLSFCVLEAVAQHYGSVLAHAGSALCTWAVCALSDYCFHRFIWHAHWSLRQGGFFFGAVHNQYVQHYIGHHKHSLDPPTMLRMRALEASPMSGANKAAIERGLDPSDVFALECSNHGFTVGTNLSLEHMWGCRLHTAATYLAMPTGTMVLWCVMTSCWTAALVHMCAVSFPIWLTVHHDKYHATSATRKAWAASRSWAIERWFWACGGIDAVTREHRKHHHGLDQDRQRFFGLMPGGFLVLYPIWQTW